MENGERRTENGERRMYIENGERRTGTKEKGRSGVTEALREHIHKNLAVKNCKISVDWKKIF
jgi:hypothetical protein